MPGKHKQKEKRFVKKCGCLNHDLFTENDTIKFALRNRAFFHDRMEYAELENRGLVESRVSNICTICLDYGRKKMQITSRNKCSIPSQDHMNDTSDSVQDEHDTMEEVQIEETLNEEQYEMDARMDVDEMDATDDSLENEIQSLSVKIKNLKWAQLSNSLKSALSGLSQSLGDTIKSEIDNEKFKMANECSSLEKLIAINKKSWYKKRNELLRGFIRGCTGVDPENSRTSDKKFNACLHAIEQIIYAKNINIVTPFAFKRNILTYIISKSKTACNIAGSWESSGSYTKVNSLLNVPSEPLTIQDSSDIVVTFDNEQKVGRHSGRIREGSKQPISIITTVAVLETRPETRYQFLHASRKELDLRKSFLTVEVLENRYREAMRVYREHFIEEIIESVLQEQFIDDGDRLQDYVDISLLHKGKYICPACCHIDSELFEKCPSCNFNTSFHEHGFDKYFRTKSQHIGKPSIEDAEPTLKNPGSVANVKLVLENIEDQCLNTSQRQWVVVMCDGVPYVFAANLQDNYKVCCVCQEYVENEQIKTHSETHDVGGKYEVPFSNIYLRPGPGHIELNMARLLLSFLWVPLMKELATGFGFRTPNALNVFRNGVDHHRSRQVLESCLFALAKELILPYIRTCVDTDGNGITPTCQGYFQWYQETVKSQNYAFLFHVTFSYLLSFHLFNEAVRKNNSENMMAARTTFAPLFFRGHHPKYQLLLVRDVLERANYADEVSPYATMTESHSASGSHSGGQGGDFVHEEVNKRIKSFLPPLGLPSKQTWVNIIRKAKTIQEMKASLLDQSGVFMEDGKKRPKRFDHEVTMVRRMIRETLYLDNIDEAVELTTINNEPLDKSLCDFNYILKDNYNLYKEELIQNKTYGTKKMSPVFITKEERENFDKIENKTIAEIKKNILDITNEMPNKDIALTIRQQVEKKTVKRKHQYIELFYEAQKHLEVQLAETLTV